MMLFMRCRETDVKHRQQRKDKSLHEAQLFNYATVTNEYFKVDTFSNRTEYKRNIHAVYIMYSNEAGRFGYQAGLRGEYTDRVIESTAAEDPFFLDRWDYFPTAHLSYKLGGDQQLMASYSRRIERPRSWWLEPFITYVDAFNVRQGNPNLKPEYVDSYEVNYRKGFGKSNYLSAEAFYRVTKNKVERIREVFSGNVIKTYPVNVGNDYSLGMELALSVKPSEWWQADISGNIFHYRITGKLEDQDFFQESVNWNTRMNNNFKIAEINRIQLSTRYVSSTVRAQGRSEGFWGVDLAIARDFMKKKATLNLQLQNIFQTERREGSTEGPGFRTYDLSYRIGPIAILTFTYRFNDYKKRRGGPRDATGGDDF